MNKKSFVLALIIGSIAVLIYGVTGSGAWFTGSAATTGTISSGNFELKVTGGPLQLAKIEPGAGYQPAGEFCLQNNGNYDMKFRGYMKNVNDPGSLRSYLLMKIEIKAQNETDQNNYGPTDNAFVLVKDVPFTDLMVWNDTLTLTPDKAMMAWNDKIAQIPQIPWGPDNHPAPFAPEMKACYKVSAKLSDAAGNDQISKTITTDLFISATQWINPGW